MNVAKKENSVILLEDNYNTTYEGFDPNSPESMIGLTLMQEDYLDQSILLARYVQDNFTYKLKRKNRGVKQAGFWVLHNTYMPSILIETGFITNKSEGDYLNSQKGKIDVSRSISDAILNYKSKLNSDSFSHKVKGWILINAEANKEEKAIKSMMKLPEITGLYTTNGKWDLAAEITSTSLEGFDRAISALRSINGVLETETSLLLSSRIGE